MSRIPQNGVTPGSRRFHANRFNPAFAGTRGAAGGRCGHGLSSSFSVSPRIESTLVLSVTPARCRLSVRARFTVSARRLSARVIESCRLLNERITCPAASRTSSVTSWPPALSQ